MTLPSPSRMRHLARRSPGLGAVLPDLALLEVDDSLAALDDPELVLVEDTRRFLVVEVEVALPDRVVRRRQAEATRVRGRSPDEPALEILEVDVVARVLEEELQQVLVALQLRELLRVDRDEILLPVSRGSGRIGPFRLSVGASEWLLRKPAATSGRVEGRLGLLHEPPREILRRHRLAEEVALRGVAAEALEDLPRRSSSRHPRRRPRSPRLRPRSIAERTIACPSASSSIFMHEAAVDLDLVDRQRLQVRERASSRCRSRRSRGGRRARAAARARSSCGTGPRASSLSVISSSSSAAGTPGRRARARPRRGARRRCRFRVETLTATASSRPVVEPGARLRHAGSSTYCVSGFDQPGLLGERDELVRHHQPALGVLPAQQRLDAVDPAGRERRLRLVVEDELLLARSRGAARRRG